MSKEEKEAIKELDIFVNSRTDMKCISSADLKIIYNLVKKQEMEIKKITKENNFLKRGYRAMSFCLDYNTAIISILQKLGLKEIEIDMKDYLKEEHELEVEHTHNNSFKIRLLDRKE